MLGNVYISNVVIGKNSNTSYIGCFATRVNVSSFNLTRVMKTNEKTRKKKEHIKPNSNHSISIDLFIHRRSILSCRNSFVKWKFQEYFNTMFHIRVVNGWPRDFRDNLKSPSISILCIVCYFIFIFPLPENNLLRTVRCVLWSFSFFKKKNTLTQECKLSNQN